MLNFLAPEPRKEEPDEHSLAAHDLRELMKAVADLESKASEDPGLLGPPAMQEAVVVLLERENTRAADALAKAQQTGIDELDESYSVDVDPHPVLL